MAYKCFVRTWWVKGAGGKIIPGPGKKHYEPGIWSEKEARAMCQEYNSTHKPGKLSKKMEYESGW